MFLINFLLNLVLSVLFGIIGLVIRIGIWISGLLLQFGVWLWKYCSGRFQVWKASCKVKSVKQDIRDFKEYKKIESGSGR